jgi:hypothetical protein
VYDELGEKVCVCINLTFMLWSFGLWHCVPHHYMAL